MVDCVEEYTNISEVPKPFMMTVIEKTSYPYVFRAEIHQRVSGFNIFVLDASGDIALQRFINSSKADVLKPNVIIPIALEMLDDVIFKAFCGKNMFGPEQFNTIT